MAAMAASREMRTHARTCCSSSRPSQAPPHSPQSRHSCSHQFRRNPPPLGLVVPGDEIADFALSIWFSKSRDHQVYSSIVVVGSQNDKHLAAILFTHW
ncbi:hypothetical protein EJB05_27185 [Eragrostis curvula]|uniref:Uncharacterized protein n=1 Tax=Eragrostis curvula TaxID=38414 RepID=A0A5J9UN94_9POAL|nr:hypothetical protein EJB05_27185 [Eragrostis curvula]